MVNAAAVTWIAKTVPIVTRLVLIKPVENNRSVLYFADGSSRIINEVPCKIIASLCQLAGSSIEGRTSSFKLLTHSYQKPCIYITNDLFLLPDASITAKDAQFVNFFECSLIKNEDFYAKVLTMNGREVRTNISYAILKKQYEKASFYLKQLSDNEASFARGDIYERI